MTADEPVPLRSDEDVVRARHKVRELAQRAGLRLVDQTKLVTAVSEIRSARSSCSACAMRSCMSTWMLTSSR